MNFEPLGSIWRIGPGPAEDLHMKQEKKRWPAKIGNIVIIW
jgi:hypothetical protein